MPRAWYKYSSTASGTGAEFLPANYSKTPDNQLPSVCAGGPRTCAIYVYYAPGTTPPNKPVSLSSNIQDYIPGAQSSGTYYPLITKAFVYQQSNV